MIVDNPHAVTYIRMMQTALHITALVSELRSLITDAKIVSTEFYRKERTVYFFFKSDKNRLALGFTYHQAGPGVFVVPASKVRIETREKPWPVFDLVGGEITAVTQMGLDRIFAMDIEREDRKSRVVFEVLGPNGNMWWLDENNGRKATLRKKTFTENESYEPAPPPDRINPFDLTTDRLAELMQSGGGASALTLIEKHLLGFNRTLAREAMTRAAIAPGLPEDLDHDAIQALSDTITDLARRFEHADSGYLYEIRSGFETYPFKLKAIESPPPEKFKTLSLAVMTMCGRRRVSDVEADEEKTTLSAVGRAIKRLERRLVNVRKDFEQAADFETYKHLGELLQINYGKIKKGMDNINVEDIYDASAKEVAIKLDPALSPADNADAYFRRYRKGRDGHDLLARRIEITEAELVYLRTILADLEQNFDGARERYREDLTALMPREAIKRDALPRLPYREHTLSTGLRIYIGRDGADNDRTTFEFAKPHELWFHAQQCPGSHVVIKHPNKSFQPSKAEIEETAAIAAFHSKARNDSLVPVIYTERRYVRKPRKAKPGLVTVEREKSIMVAPRSEQA